MLLECTIDKALTKKYLNVTVLLQQFSSLGLQKFGCFTVELNKRSARRTYTRSEKRIIRKYYLIQSVTYIMQEKYVSLSLIKILFRDSIYFKKFDLTYY